MPLGLIVFSWNKRIGAEVLIKYPDDFQISNDTLMRIFSTHAFEEAGGFLSMIIGALNIASYYSGPEKGLYISLFLALEEDPDPFEDAILDLSNLILSTREIDKIKPLIPSHYARIALYPKLSDEQKIANAFADRAKHITLDHLDEEGSSSKTELTTLIKDMLQLEYLDINAVLNSLIKLGLIKVSSIKGLPSEGVFLIGNAFVTRTPSKAALQRLSHLEISPEIQNDFLAEIKTYFQQYKPQPADNEALINLIINSDTYLVLNLLRLSPVTEQGLNKVKNQVKDIKTALKQLWDLDILRLLKTKKGEEYYILKSDIRIQKYFPEYILNTIRTNYNQKTKPPQVLVEHLKHLREVYLLLPEDYKRTKPLTQEAS